VASQIQFTNDGAALVVDKRGSDTIDTFLVSLDGAASPALQTWEDLQNIAA
jgi:hypothetical protein